MARESGSEITAARSSTSIEPDLDAEGRRFARLDELVRTLVARFQALERDHAALRERLEERDERVRGLEEELLQLNQRRRDAAKRVEDLIAQLDHLDARLADPDAHRPERPGGAAGSA